MHKCKKLCKNKYIKAKNKCKKNAKVQKMNANKCINNMCEK